MVLAPSKGYLIDSSALIELFGGKNPQAPLNFLTKLAQSGRFRVPAAVLREIDRQDDKLRGWATRNREVLTVPETAEILAHHDHVIERYGPLFTTSDGAADPLVVCTAIHFRDHLLEDWDVVANDTAVRVALNQERIFTLTDREFRIDAGF